MRVREIWVEWLNENRARSLFLQRRAKAMAKGERVSPEETDSICDWVEDSECLESRKFPTLGLAKGWARRNVGLDMFENPRIHVNEFDDRDPWDTKRFCHWSGRKSSGL